MVEKAILSHSVSRWPVLAALMRIYLLFKLSCLGGLIIRNREPEATIPTAPEVGAEWEAVLDGRRTRW